MAGNVNETQSSRTIAFITETIYCTS